MIQRRFERQGLLALAPSAFMGMFLEPPVERVVTIIGDVGVVDVQGPLVHHAGGWTDSYEEIVDRVSAALAETQVRTVVLRIDSPGGDVHGCFDAARTLRERARAAGKPLVSWITGNGCSGAYALACAGSTIQVSDTACVGSIGILCTRLDQTAADAQIGVGFTLITSGARKPDQNPHTAPSAAELGAMQAQCDALAAVFFDVVSAMRPGLSADAVRALEAGTFIGSEAVRLGLADGVAADLTAAVAAAGSASARGTVMEDEEEQTAAAAESSSSQTDVDEARAALQRAANDGNARARRALAALDEGEDAADEESEEASAEADEDEDSASASAAAAAPAARGAGAPAARAGAAAARASSVPARVAGTIAARLEAVSARLDAVEAERDSARLTALLQSRPDLTPELRRTLGTFTEAQARAVLDGMPRPARRTAATAAAGAQATGAAPAAGGRRPGGSDPELARAFGLSAQVPLVEHSTLTSTFRVPQTSRGRRFDINAQTTTQQQTQTAAPASEPSNGRG